MAVLSMMNGLITSGHGTQRNIMLILYRFIRQHMSYMTAAERCGLLVVSTITPISINVISALFAAWHLDSGLIDTRLSLYQWVALCPIDAKKAAHKYTKLAEKNEQFQSISGPLNHALNFLHPPSPSTSSSSDQTPLLSPTIYDRTPPLLTLISIYNLMLVCEHMTYDSSARDEVWQTIIGSADRENGVWARWRQWLLTLRASSSSYAIAYAAPPSIPSPPSLLSSSSLSSSITTAVAEAASDASDSKRSQPSHDASNKGTLIDIRMEWTHEMLLLAKQIEQTKTMTAAIDQRYIFRLSWLIHEGNTSISYSCHLVIP
jgi:hypothetical protein